MLLNHFFRNRIKLQGAVTLFSVLVVCYILSSCSNSRHLAEGESLYMGSKVKITDTVIPVKERKLLETELSESVRPLPNSNIFGLRLKLSLYNMVGVPKKEKGLRNWLRNQVGEPPVLGSKFNIKSNVAVLENILHNYGYFEAQAAGDKITEKQKTTGNFEVNTGPRTFIRKVGYPQSDTGGIVQEIFNIRGGSVLREGEAYNLANIVAERERIDRYLKENGYYYFSPEFMLVRADTGFEANKLDLTVKLKAGEIPEEATQKYYINEVLILPNYRLNNGQQRIRRDSTRVRRVVDTTRFEGFRMVDRQKAFRPSVFAQAMQLKEGELYNRRDQNIALNRLVTLGAFKFVKNEFTPVNDSVGNNKLNVAYLLTPYSKKSFNGEFGGFTQDDSRGGVRGSVTYRNRNAFRGVENFTSKLVGSFEAQFGRGELSSQRPNAYNFGWENSLNIPRFIVPFVTVKPSSVYIPRTVINAKYNYSLRKDFYQINALNFAFGYNWKEEARKDHKLFPFNITLVKTDTFDAGKASLFNLSNLIFNGIIFGPTYNYNYNSQLDGVKRKNSYFFDGLIDLSGNIIGLAQNANYDSPSRIFGSNYAQYIKAQTDFRYYRNMSKKSVLATRALFGYGYAYGNSYNLPNIKQFFSGGSSSLRGFTARLVGPGTFNERYYRGTDSIFEILGDIKAEFNIEYRYKFYRFFEAGFFVDAGNIWLLRDNPTFPGGKFTSNFYKQLAVDGGLGLRIDLSILLIRLDFALPLRQPWYIGENEDQWRFKHIDFGDPDWRKSNLFFMFAIGYPF